MNGPVVATEIASQHIYHPSAWETFKLRMPEWGFGLMLLGWAVVLAINTTAFEVNPIFSVLRQIGPQWCIVAACAIVGTARLVILIINGALRRSPHLRALASFVSCFFWFSISIGIFKADNLSTGLAVYPVLFLMDAFNVIKAAEEAALLDTFCKAKSDAKSDA